MENSRGTPLTDEGVYDLIGAIVKISLKDLFTEPSKKATHQKRAEIIRKRQEAILFFTNSNLFKLSGLNYEYLVDRYKKDHLKKRIK